MWQTAGKVLMVSCIGFFLSTDSQGMDFFQEDDVRDIPIVPLNFKDLEIESDRGSKNPIVYNSIDSKKEDVSLPRSYESLQILYEYLLYEYCDPTLHTVGSREKKDSEKNLAYFRASLKTKKRPLSLQPSLDGLRNELGEEVEKWLAKCGEERRQYNQALIELNKRENYHKNTPSPQNQKLLEEAQGIFKAVLNKLLKMHGPQEVMLGEREATEEEVIKIKDKITLQSKIIITPRAFYSSVLSRGTPYFGEKDSKSSPVQAFILKPNELQLAYDKLERLVSTLEREHHILLNISVFYKQTFLKRVEGWAAWQIANWFYLSQQVETAQNEIKELIGSLEALKNKYPLSPPIEIWTRDRTVDSGEVLAHLNKDERGKNLRNKLLFKIKKLPLGGNDQQGDSSFGSFAKIYCGVDELEQTRAEEGCHIEAGFPFSSPIKVEFEKIKRRQYHCDLTETQVTDFPLPKGAQMVEEYPCLAHVIEHKIIWREVVKELHKRPLLESNSRLEKRDFSNHYSVITSYEDLFDSVYDISFGMTYERYDLIKYNELYHRYRDLLAGHIKLLHEMYRPYSAYITSISRGWKFFISEGYRESLIPAATSQDIVLNDVSIRDEDMERKRRTQDGYQYMFCCYLNLDLSRNSLTGDACYHFSELITKLNLSQNHISSLKFLDGLRSLKILDLSNNCLSDLSCFLNFSNLPDQGCLSLQEVDFSHNEIEDVSPLSVLKILQKLNLSNNKIRTLVGFHEKQSILPYNGVSQDQVENEVRQMLQKNMATSLLIELNVENNQLSGSLENVFSKGLKNLQTLKVKGNSQLKLGQKSDDNLRTFRDYFPQLKTLSTD